MEIWLFTVKISGHLKNITKIGDSEEDCLWKLEYCYRDAKSIKVVSSQLIQKIPFSDGKEISISHQKYLKECDEILRNIKYDARGFEIF